jgi:hypothetical protein
LDAKADKKPVPRKLEREVARARACLLVVVFLGAAVVGWLGFEMRQSYRLRWHGQPTVGTIVRLWSYPGVHDHPVWMADYTFFDGATPLNGSDEVSKPDYNKARIGDRLTVVFLPFNPSLSEATPGHRFQTSLWRFCQGLVIWFIAWAFVAAFFEHKRRKREVWKRGVARLATVTGRDPYFIRGNASATHSTMTWRDEQGQTGRSEINRNQQLPPIGSTVAIYADPSGKLPSVWEGDCGPR